MTLAFSCRGIDRTQDGWVMTGVTEEQCGRWGKQVFVVAPGSKSWDSANSSLETLLSRSSKLAGMPLAFSSPLSWWREGSFLFITVSFALQHAFSFLTWSDNKYSTSCQPASLLTINSFFKSFSSLAFCYIQYFAKSTCAATSVFWLRKLSDILVTSS